MPRVGIWDDYPASLHLEPTKSCNARCPQCMRTFNNSLETTPNLIEEEIDPDWIYEMLMTDIFFSKVKNILVNGNEGDLIMHSNPKRFIEVLFEAGMREVQVNTNGSGLNRDFWKWAGRFNRELNKKHRRLTFTFAVDGLHDTHHLYRRNTRLDTILKNMKIFSDEGGDTLVAMNVNGNNKHQVEEVHQLVKDHGALAITTRYNERFHDLKGRSKPYEILYDKKFEPVDTLLMSTEASDEVPKLVSNLPDHSMLDYSLRVESPKAFLFKKQHRVKPYPVEKSNRIYPKNNLEVQCAVNSKSFKGNFNSFYVSADGRLWPCCWTEVDFKSKTQFNQPSSWIDTYYYEMTDPYFNSLYHYTSKEILSLDCFSKLSDTWETSSCVEFCSKNCGKEGLRFTHEKTRKWHYE